MKSLYRPFRLTSSPGEIISARTNCPGSWHDPRVAAGIYEKLELETPEGFRLAADSAFPGAVGDSQVTSSCHYSTVTPYRRMEMNVDPFSPSLVLSCLTVKQQSGACSSFRDHLCVFPSPFTSTIGNNDRTSLSLASVSTTSRRLVGINQIRNVYSRTDEHPWAGFVGFVPEEASWQG